MPGRDTLRPPKIFLSFASEDGYWVRWFTHKDWFGLQIGNVIVENYLAGDNLDFGPLRSWLDQRIDEATVVIAFISEFYREKKWTDVEWNKALTEVQRRRLIFVPIMLDAGAKAWWADLLDQGKLSALPDDYMYSDFTDDRGDRLAIADNDRVQTKIARLAGRIKAFLSAPPPPARSSIAPSEDSVARSTGAEVVILGHPTNRLAEDIASQAHALAEAAQEDDLLVQKWGDGWLRNSAARGAIGVSADMAAVFVQPLAAGDASEQVGDVGRTGKRLAVAGVPDAPVVLWMPSGQSDPDFETAVAPPTEALPDLPTLRTRPALRIDPPRELSLQLRTILRSTPLFDDPVLQIETVGSPGGRPDMEAIRLSKKLSQMFGDIVNAVVVTESPPWEFWDAEQFKAQIAQIRGSRAIVAVHDLDVAPSADAVANRKRIELKFQLMQDYVRQAEFARKLKFFWAALLFKNANALPFGRYPSGRFNQWRLLNFARADDGGATDLPVRPDPASLGVFQTALSEWAAV